MRTHRHGLSGGRISSRPRGAERNPRRPAGVTPADAKKSYERYVALARAAASTGDAVEIENLYQHAEHYFRLMREQAG
jgi:hypothetical protein